MSESLDRGHEVPELTPEQIQARVLHRDGLMLVIDKPSGLPVHRGPKGGANLESSFDALRFGLPRPPVLAHRLDRDTSGCLVLGRHRKATASLGLLFKHGKISKTYWAVVEGGPAEEEGTIDMPARPPQRRARLVAETRSGGTDGRHQLESAGARRRPELGSRSNPSPAAPINCGVHSAAMGWPIVGDNIYGNGPRFGEPTLHLHSREIVVPISKNKEAGARGGPAPVHLHGRLRACGWNGE